jgi:NAD(P)-dependent dehydrogenase (short-subunit alcohol dehydrogenase family)
VTVELRDRVVVVTGASLGIGRETALALAREGARLGLTYLEHRDEGEQVVARCRELGARDVRLFSLDQGDETSIRSFVAAVVAHFDGVDVLVNNAGIVVWGEFLEQSVEQIDAQLRVDLVGVLKLTWLILPHVRDAVVNVASTASLHGSRRLVPYGAAKWGVRGFTKALAKEHPELRLYSVHPAPTRTRMNPDRGMPPGRVAEVVVSVVRGDLELEPGADVDLRDFA